MNANYETSQAARVRAMPTFQFFQNGKKKHEFSGADSRQLQQLVSQMSSKAERHGTYVGVEVSPSSLEVFYTKHDPDKGRFPPSFSASFNGKVQKLPLFSCISIRNEGKNRPKPPMLRRPPRSLLAKSTS